eukprot:3010590-Rhodomonas_salina.2
MSSTEIPYAPISLRVCYAISGAEIAYQPARRCGTDREYPPTVLLSDVRYATPLRNCFAMSDTGQAYGVLSVLREVRYCDRRAYAMSGTCIAYRGTGTGYLSYARTTRCARMMLRRFYAMCGTDTAYGATRHCYAMCGTAIAYGATSLLCNVQY